MSNVRLIVPPPAAFFTQNDTQPIAPQFPHAIPSNIYNALLDGRIPVTIALIYAVSVHYMNTLVPKNKPAQPYPIAKTAAFKYFVILHNAFLAIYSAWTFQGITSALYKTVNWSNGLGDIVHGLCKIHPTSLALPLSNGNSFESIRYSSVAGSGLWEEGLAFYGWLFYLSKFYEVIDTMIILAKGRKSSTLQTYHHAGAMLCMWTGIRYMAAPIFIFVCFNSFIHTLMYTYYTLSAFKIRVPMFVKSMLTSLQILQFLIGGSGAAVHLFLSYIPPTALTGISETVKETAGIDLNLNREFVSCLSTRGEMFAVITNVVYLTPLTYLFVMFFIKSYLTPKDTGAAKKAN